MSMIDHRIAMGFKPTTEIEPPLNNLARLMQVESLQNQNQLARMNMVTAQQEAAENNRLMQYLRTNPDLNSEQGRSGLYGASPLKASSILKGHSESIKSGVQLDQERLKIAQERYGIYKQAVGSLLADPNVTKEAVIRSGQELVAMGLLPQSMVEQAVSNLPDDPSALRENLKMGIATQLKPDQIFTLFAPKPTEINDGQSISFRDTNPNSPTYGQQTAGPQVQRLQTPESMASNRITMRGQDLVNARSKEANEIASTAIVSKRVQDTELKLQDDYRTESKGFAETSTAMKKILGAIETADKNPGSALSAGTAFMKLLDPNSVVRESELGMALNASGWFDRATNIANTLQSGRIMTQTQKQNLKSAAESLFEEAKAAQREVDAAYERRARDYGADPSRVIVDRGQRSTGPERKSGLPSIDEINAELARRQGGR